MNCNIKVFQFLHIKWFNLLTKITLKDKILLLIDSKLFLFIDIFFLQKTRNLKFFPRRRDSNSFNFFDSLYIFVKFIFPVSLKFAFWNIFRLFGSITLTVTYIFRQLWVFISYDNFLSYFLSLISLRQAIMLILFCYFKRIEIAFGLPILNWIFIFDLQWDISGSLINVLRCLSWLST